MTRATLLRKLRALNACDDAVAWLKSTDHATLQDAWDACERADWMLWLLIRMNPHERRGPIRHAICDCAETALRYIPVGEDRPRRAIAVARLYAEGSATDDELAAARDAAWVAAGDAARAAAGAAAWDAAWAAAGDAAGAAARAAAGDAAGAAAWDAAWAAALKDMAAIVRKRVPNPEAP